MRYLAFILLLFTTCQATETGTNISSSSSNELFSFRSKFEDNYSGKIYPEVKNSPIFITNTFDKSIYIELNYKGDSYGIIPFIVTKNAIGEPIDSMDLTTNTCYVGTDSHYIPYIEISEDRTIKVIDSTFITAPSGFKTIELESGELLIVALGDNFLYIAEEKFQIDDYGKFEKSTTQWRIINLSDSTKN